ncbi:NAD(P)-binding protein [Atractiella rhizophila]|nr:NAD(P)-binding protein [Atractiella rhizophila]
MSGTTVLITGCSEGGLGHGMCKAFAQKGCTVFATARTVSKMVGLAEEGCILLQLDVKDQSSCETAVKAILEDERSGGKIDILINNAAVAHFVPILDSTVEEMEQLFAANLFGVMRMTKLVAPAMVTRRSGKILNVGSVAGEGPFGFWHAIYGASKAALHSWSIALGAELEPFNVQVSLVVVGATDSGAQERIQKMFRLPDNSFYKPIESNISNAIIPPAKTPVVEFAGKTANLMLKDTVPGKWWTSKMSNIVWALTWWNPVSLGRMFGGQNGTKELKAEIESH